MCGNHREEALTFVDLEAFFHTGAAGILMAVALQEGGEFLTGRESACADRHQLPALDAVLDAGVVARLLDDLAEQLVSQFLWRMHGGHQNTPAMVHALAVRVTVPHEAVCVCVRVCVCVCVLVSVVE
jgi:hypothetical protein